jgi:hypothetical protein
MSKEGKLVSYKRKCHLSILQRKHEVSGTRTRKVSHDEQGAAVPESSPHGTGSQAWSRPGTHQCSCCEQFVLKRESGVLQRSAERLNSLSPLFLLWRQVATMTEPAPGILSGHGEQSLSQSFLQRLMRSGPRASQERFELGEGLAEWAKNRAKTPAETTLGSPALQ